MTDKLVLDLETKLTFDEVGGHHNSHKLGVSVVGVYSYGRETFRAFRENEFAELKAWLEETDTIVGFNSKHFDFNVLQPYFKSFNLSKLPHLDILEEVVFALGHRLKLETIAQATLGRGKSGDGLDAIRYFRAGDWASLEKYCLDDVRVTRDIFDYGHSHGYIWYTNNGVKQKIVARWSQGDTVEDIIKRALMKGLQLEIDYIGDEGVTTKDTIDVQQFDGTRVKAYSHRASSVRVLDLARIKRAQDRGAMRSFQASLL